MTNRVYGNVVLFEGDSLESTVLRLITRSSFTHVAIQTDENKAESIDMRSGLIYHNLDNPSKDYKSYIILQHKEMTQEKRWSFQMLNKHIGKEYDVYRWMVLAYRHIKQVKQDNQDIATTERDIHTDSSRIALMYVLNNLPIGLKDIHYSQVESRQFFNLVYFNIIKEWNRDAGFL